MVYDADCRMDKSKHQFEAFLAATAASFRIWAHSKCSRESEALFERATWNTVLQEKRNKDYAVHEWEHKQCWNMLLYEGSRLYYGGM